MRTKFKAFLLLFSLQWASFALGDGDGHLLVQSELPEFYDAACEVLSPQRANSIFADWTEEDVNLIKKHLVFLYRATKYQVGPVSHPLELQHKYIGSILGIFGEVNGNQIGRELEVEGKRFFIDEETYRQANPNSKLHDGILLAYEHGQLIIHMIVESKIGGATYDRAQVGNTNPERGQLGYLRVWQLRGMNVDLPSGAQVWVQPEDIYLSTNMDPLPIADAEVPDIESRTLLIGTGDPPGGFLGDYRQLTLNPSLEEPVHVFQIKDLVFRMITKLIAGRQVSEVSTEQMRSPVAMDGEALSDYRSRLETYIFEFGHLPRSTIGEDGAVLSRLISQRGNRADVFIRDVSSAGKAELARRGEIPPLALLRKKILELSPYLDDGAVNLNAIGALLAYIYVYEAERSLSPQQVPAQEILQFDPAYIQFVLPALYGSRLEGGILEDLVTESPEWRQWGRYFGVLDVTTESDLTPEGDGACPASFL